MAAIVLTSPVRGWAMPLDEVPDPVFAERMLGDGVAVDPVGSCLHAPCDGTVLSIHAARHAITLRTVGGAEILMHIGLDTVALEGDGFTAHVAAGASVRQGDLLIGFDLALLLERARAVVTPVVLANPERFAITHRTLRSVVGPGQPLLTIEARDETGAAEEEQGEGEDHRLFVVVPLPHGIHARPAARITEAARTFRSEARILLREGSANARSATGLLALGVRCGDRIEIVTRGADAAEAAEAIAALVAGGMGEVDTAPTPTAAPPRPTVPAPPVPPMASDNVFSGVLAAPGLVAGRTHRFLVADRLVERDAADPARERAALEGAIRLLRERMTHGMGGLAAAIQLAHAALLDDPDLLEAAEQLIAAGRSASFAWRTALRAQADRIRELDDDRLAARADDLLDVERQLLDLLAGGQTRTPPLFPPNTILLADDLLPSDLTALDPARVVGICTARGGPTSHVAILAAGLRIPTLVAVGAALLAVEDDVPAILDADAGSLTVRPDEGAWTATGTAILQRSERQAAARAAAGEPAFTRDGLRVKAFANLASVEDARLAVANGAEGSGLLRTEFLFLDRNGPPSEAEQAETYQSITDILAGRPLIIRLLDVGGDKPAPYLPIAPEENPALGLRGIRVGLAHPRLLRTQLRAILSVQPLDACRIMVPMVASLAELRLVRAALDEARGDLGIAGPMELGIMVETPAAAATADILAAEADFLSIGSNDLTQYALAMDRGNAAVAKEVDGLHPAVLRLIGQTCLGAARHGRWTGVCGGLASDPLAVPLLIGLGVTELSATPALVPEVKAVIRAVTLSHCRQLAEQAKMLASPAEVRELAGRFLGEIAA